MRLEDLSPDNSKERNFYNLSDTRKPRLTLMHLNKLKKIRIAREKELASQRDFYSTMYGKKSQDDQGSSPF